MKVKFFEKQIVKVVGKDITIENTDRYLTQVESICPCCGMKAWFDPWQELNALCQSCEEEAKDLGWGEPNGLGWGEPGARINR